MTNDSITSNDTSSKTDIRIKASELKHPGNFGGQITQQISEQLQQQLTRQVARASKAATPPPIRPHLVAANATRKMAMNAAVETAHPAPARGLHAGLAETDFFIQSRQEDTSSVDKRMRSKGDETEFRLPSTWRTSAVFGTPDEEWQWSERTTAAFLGFAAGILIIVPTVMLLSAGSGEQNIETNLGLIEQHRIEARAIASSNATTASTPDQLSATEMDQIRQKQLRKEDPLTATASATTALPLGIWYDSGNETEVPSPPSTGHSTPQSTAEPMTAPHRSVETRARAAFHAGDISTARTILRDAASPQRPELWFMLAETYDPALGLVSAKQHEPTTASEPSVAARIEIARHYYKQALAHGINQAEQRLAQLMAPGRSQKTD